MGLMMMKKKNIRLLFLLLISAILLSATNYSVAGRGMRFLLLVDDYKPPRRPSHAHLPPTYTTTVSEEEGINVDDDEDLHERLLKKDYGNYEPAPALRHPPSMIINN